MGYLLLTVISILLIVGFARSHNNLDKSSDDDDIRNWLLEHDKKERQKGNWEE